MKKITKFGKPNTTQAIFEHNDDFTGEVSITKGTASVILPMAILIEFVAESVRIDAIDEIRKAKPASLIKRLA